MQKHSIAGFGLWLVGSAFQFSDYRNTTVAIILGIIGGLCFLVPVIQNNSSVIAKSMSFHRTRPISKTKYYSRLDKDRLSDATYELSKILNTIGDNVGKLVALGNTTYTELYWSTKPNSSGNQPANVEAIASRFKKIREEIFQLIEKIHKFLEQNKSYVGEFSNILQCDDSNKILVLSQMSLATIDFSKKIDLLGALNNKQAQYEMLSSLQPDINNYSQAENAYQKWLKDATGRLKDFRGSL